MKGLTAGRMVHYVLIGNEEFIAGGQKVLGTHRPAVVVDVKNMEIGKAELHVFVSKGDGYIHSSIVVEAPYSEGGEPGTWHWIEPA